MSYDIILNMNKITINGQLIKDKRLSLGLSRDELNQILVARYEVSFTPYFIYCVEQQYKLPSAVRLYGLCKTLDLSLDDVFTEEKIEEEKDTKMSKVITNIIHNNEQQEKSKVDKKSK